MTVPIQADALRVGMFVHLNVGWMSHPFPLSSFKIASAEQLETIRGLGLKKITWSPDRSDPDPAAMPAPGGAEASAATGASVADGDAPAGTGAASTDALAQQGPGAELAADAAAAAAFASSPTGPRATARDALASQRDATARCERQFTEACRDLRRATEKAATEPTVARDEAQMLARALLDKMLVDGEPCLRVLGETSVDRASAHAMNVTVVSLLLARQLDVPRPIMLDLGVGALMHDIGKTVLPDRVRIARDDFTHAEQALYRDHVAEGVAIGRRMGLPAEAQLVIAQHHEYADGSGFPSGLPLARMSLGARIVSMVNKYDNLCHGHTPAQSLTPHEALSRMFAQARAKFDQALLSGFIKMMGIYPPGSVVQLTDDRYAMVMTVNAAHPLKPRVLPYDAAVPLDDAMHLDLGEHPRLGIRRSLRTEQIPGRVAEYLHPRQRISYFFDVEPERGALADVREGAVA